MATPTVDLLRADDRCLHKLATSCRLTATTNCCACADRRPHSPWYPKYIDGIGFVQRATRWETYCWSCKAFWENRVVASRLNPEESRIPEQPDVTAFIERWLEFYQGYRIHRRPDGTERRITVRGDDPTAVAPGTMPRTLNQVRAEARSREHAQNAIQPPRSRRLETGRRHRTLSEFPRRLVGWTDNPSRSAERPPQLPPVEHTNHGIFAQPDPPAQADAPSLPAFQQGNAGPTATAAPTLGPESQQSNEATTEASNPPTGDLVELSESRWWGRERRLAEQITRVFGPREEIQSDEYVSPIAGLFNRAWGRYHNREDMRRAQESVEAAENFPVPSEPSFAARWPTLSAEETLHSQRTPEPRRERQWINWGDVIAAQHAGTRVWSPEGSTQDEHAATNTWRLHGADSTQAYPGLDGDDRPEPMTDEQMMIKLECKVCLQQQATVACLPCGHLGLCKWCADQAIPVRETDATRPVGHKKCPMCRKQVNRRVSIFVP